MARCDEAGSELFCARFLSVLDSSLNPKNPARPDSLNHIILKALKEAPPLAATKGLAILKKKRGVSAQACFRKNFVCETSSPSTIVKLKVKASHRRIMLCGSMGILLIHYSCASQI